MIRRTALALALASAFTATPVSAQDDIRAELDALRAELQRMRSEMAELKQKQAGTLPPAQTAAPAATAVAVTPVPPPARTSSFDSPAAGGTVAAPVAAEAGSPLSFTGYGELSVTLPKNRSQSTATVGRLVTGVNYRFDERTKLVTEIEVEQAVASADDVGEVAVEQAYIEHQFSENIAAKAGLFLMPLGYINETHEPPYFYGVNRNFVETAIIPSTWREMGIGLSGNALGGLRWDTGVTTSFDITKWDSSNAESIESPLASIHQEGSQAHAGSLAVYGALNWNGTPGLNIGGGFFAGGLGQHQDDFASPDASLTLYEVHARWTPGDWDLSALYSAGRFSNTEAFNLTLVGNPYPVPKSFSGWYVQGAYKLWSSGNYSLAPFARYEAFNTAKSYDADLAQFGYNPLPTEKVFTTGASFKLNPQVVLKADYQWFQSDSDRNALNLGLGFAY